MKRAFLFPGQGVDLAPLVADWVDQPAGAEILDRAEEVTGSSRRDWLARGGRLLGRTEILQPVLTAVVLIIDQRLQEAGVRPDFAAGHSLGEIAAWACAGGIDRTDAVSLAGTRGRLMADLADRNPGGMLALTGLDQATVDTILAQVSGVDLAAHNAPGEWVLSGGQPDLETIRTSWGGRLLDVAGPWHARVMAPGAVPYRRALATVPARTPHAALVANRSGQVAADPREIPELLAGQLCHPIRWVATMRTLAAAGVDEYVIPGPGKVLRGLARQCLGIGSAIRVIAAPWDIDRWLECGRSSAVKGEDKP